jgi:DNA ligase-1
LTGFPADHTPIARDDLGDVLAADAAGVVWCFAHGMGAWTSRTKAFVSVAAMHEYLAGQADCGLVDPEASLEELQAYEERCLADGYEGVMIRTPGSPYKCGRSTEREGYLLKIKRFEDAEAVVLDTYEGMSNLNPAEKDAFGRTKRSLAQAGMIGRGELGGFIVRHLSTGVEFRLGYNHVVGGIDRVTLWQTRETLIGRVVKFSHQPSGAKDAPRFPKFLGFREAWDM